MLIFKSTAADRIILRDEGRSGIVGGLPLSNISSSTNTTMLELIKNIHVCPLIFSLCDQTGTATASETENNEILWIYIQYLSTRGTGMFV